MLGEIGQGLDRGARLHTDPGQVEIVAPEREPFMAAVEKAKEYIMGRRYLPGGALGPASTGTSDLDPLAVYRWLRVKSPSPYMFFLKFPDCHLLGSSPETLVKVENGRVLLRPIAGTRGRSADPDKDRALEREMMSSPKERAEHVMLVDLARNDAGRVSRYGTVGVEPYMTVERYSHVMHIVSQVQGQVSPELGVWDAFRAAFPAGTLSGAPKVRAMEIISELEGVARGPYGGAVGCFGPGQYMDTCIGIRMIEFHEGRFTLQVGAGIVADSDPAMEYEEICHKAGAGAGGPAPGRGGAGMIAVIDNYDSFTYNIVQALGSLGCELKVMRNDVVPVEAVGELEPEALIISPGPGRPEDAGITCAAIERYATSFPILGVCLGHQAIAQVFGAKVVRSGKPMHGKVSEVFHDARGLYAGLRNPFVAARYHSLVVPEDSVKDPLVISAYTLDGEVMGLRHKDLPVEGVQFHPESNRHRAGYAFVQELFCAAIWNTRSP